MIHAFSRIGSTATGAFAVALGVGLAMAFDSGEPSPASTLQAFLIDVDNQNFTGAATHLSSARRAEAGDDRAMQNLAHNGHRGSGVQLVVTGERVRGNSAWVYVHEDGGARADSIGMLKEAGGWKVWLDPSFAIMTTTERLRRARFAPHQSWDAANAPFVAACAMLGSPNVNVLNRAGRQWPSDTEQERRCSTCRMACLPCDTNYQL